MTRLTQENECDVGEDEKSDNDQGEPGEVLFHDCGAGESAPHPTAKRPRETSTLARVEEYQPDQRYAQQHVKKRNNVSKHSTTLPYGYCSLHYSSTGKSFSAAALISSTKDSTSRLAPPTRPPSTSSFAMSSSTFPGFMEPP